MGILDTTGGTEARHTLALHVAGCGGCAGGKPLEFWILREQFNYWSHSHLTVDVVPGRGSGFSVDAPEGVRFAELRLGTYLDHQAGSTRRAGTHSVCYLMHGCA